MLKVTAFILFLSSRIFFFISLTFSKPSNILSSTLFEEYFEKGYISFVSLSFNLYIIKWAARSLLWTTRISFLKNAIKFLKKLMMALFYPYHQRIGWLTHVRFFVVIRIYNFFLFYFSDHCYFYLFFFWNYYSDNLGLGWHYPSLIMAFTILWIISWTNGTLERDCVSISWTWGNGY